MAKEWDIKRTTFSVGDFVGWQKTGSLELSPSFQRRPVWTKAQKSYLLDTIYRGLPVPIIFIRERTDVETLSTIREVIDGQQRLRTLISFVSIESLPNSTERDKFVVARKHNKDISDMPFSRFSSAMKTRILSYQFSVHVLPSDTSDADVLSIFARMNSTGSKLNDQELRNAEFFGLFKNTAYDIAYSQLERWRKWTIFSEQDIARMKEVELTSELFMYLIEGLFEQTQRNITRYYKKFDDDFPNRAAVSSRYLTVMQAIEDNFGKQIATSGYKNRAMFFQLFVLIDRLMKGKVELSSSRARTILQLGTRIATRDELPENVLVALASRFNRLSNRQIVADFLFSNASR